MKHILGYTYYSSEDFALTRINSEIISWQILIKNLKKPRVRAIWINLYSIGTFLVKE